MVIFATTGILLSLILLFVIRARLTFRQLLATIEVVVLPGVVSAALGNKRDIVVYLPPAYATETTRHYQSLYVNDGQERQALHLRETLARLAAAGQIVPPIVISIPANDDRLNEYGTACTPSGRGLGQRAADYTQFIVAELKPMIEQQFRTRKSAAFLGASLGGLSAFDIVWNHPGEFDTVGVMSGSFWWHTATSQEWGESDPRIAHAMVRESPHRVGFRGWFQAGTRDEVSDRDQNGVIDSIQDTLELIDELVTLGYRRGEEIVYWQTEGGRHDYETWARELPRFLVWAFSPRASRPTE